MRELAIGVALLATACSAEAAKDAPDAAASGAPVGVAAAAASPAASAAPAPARSESVSNDLYEFEYSYPAAAAAIPDLKAWLDADLESTRRKLIEGAQSHLDESRKEGFPYNPFGSWTAWQVVTELPGWLSLSASVGSYQGGAHPNHGFDALLWDRQANVRREPLDLFTSRQALSRAIRAPFCRELDRQRARKRQAMGEGADAGTADGGTEPGDPFSQCIDPVESTVILGSSNRRAFDRIGILVAPYEAGPYVEGDYEVTVPVTDAVLAAVRPAYRTSFDRGR